MDAEWPRRSDTDGAETSSPMTEDLMSHHSLFAHSPLAVRPIPCHRYICVLAYDTGRTLYPYRTTSLMLSLRYALDHLRPHCLPFARTAADLQSVSIRGRRCSAHALLATRPCIASTGHASLARTPYPLQHRYEPTGSTQAPQIAGARRGTP